MKSIAAASIRHRAFVLLALLLAVTGGLFVARRLPAAIYPEVDFPRIVVVARGGDEPPDVFAATVTRPLEQSLATTLGVQRVHSHTVRGATEISLLFAPGTDMWRALQLVQSQAASARNALPATPPITIDVERLTPTAFPVVTFNLSGRADPRDLRDLADLVVRPALARVPGVGQVRVVGGDEREVSVLLDAEKAASLHLRPEDVAQRLRDRLVLAAAGRAELPAESASVVVTSAPRDLADIAAVPVATGPGGASIPLARIASVAEGHADRTTRAGGPDGETVILSVSRAEGASTADVVAAVRIAARDVARVLPAGVRLRAVYDQAALVDRSVSSVRDAIVIGIALCLLVLGVALRNARAGIVAAAVVPAVLASGFLVMRVLGQSLNIMSLGGMAVAVGLVIDDAIIVVEAIVRHLDEGLSPRDAAKRGTDELAAAVIGTTATTVVVFVPLIFVEGVVGNFFGALAGTLTAAVLLSLVVSLTAVPAVAARVFVTRTPRPPTIATRSAIQSRRSSGESEDALDTRAQSSSPLTPTIAGALAADRGDRGGGGWSTPPRRGLGSAGGLDRFYTRLAQWGAERKWAGAILLVLTLAAGAVLVKRVESGFLPSIDEGAFVLDYFLPAGTSLEQTSQTARSIERILAHTADVETFSRRTGAELGPAAATTANRGDIMVRLRANHHRSTEAVIADVRARVAAEVPTARVEFIQVLQDVLNDLSGAPRPVEVKVFGEDPAVLARIAADIAARIEHVNGLVDVYSGVEPEARAETYAVDPDAAARLGLTPRAALDTLNAAVSGAPAGALRRFDRFVPIRVRYPDAIRYAPDRLLALPVMLAANAGVPGGVPLSAIVARRTERVPSEVHHEDLQPVVTVTGDTSGRDLGSITADVARAIGGVHLPSGYRIELGGQQAAQRVAFGNLLAVAIGGILLTLLVLTAQFRDLRPSFAVLATAPFALVGALATLWMTGTPLNVSSLMGCILLVGLEVKSGILLLEVAQEKASHGMDVVRAVVEAGQRRIRPIMLTTTATLFGVLPLALGLGEGTDVLRPLALAVLGGIGLSKFVNLVALPSLAVLCGFGEGASRPDHPFALSKTQLGTGAAVSKDGALCEGTSCAPTTDGAVSQA